VVVGSGHENIVCRKSDGRAVRSVEALLLDGPGGTAVPADAKPYGSRRYHDVRTNRVSAHFVNVSVDIDGGFPGHATIGGARDTPNVNVGEKHSSVRGYSDRTDAERRSDDLAVDQRRTCIPRLSAWGSVEAAKLFDFAVVTDAQHARVIRADIDRIVD
jgi:hypothetical protein